MSYLADLLLLFILSLLTPLAILGYLTLREKAKADDNVSKNRVE